MRADLTFSENSHLTIFTTKFGGDSFDDAPLLCTPCTLSMFFKISSLVVSGKTLDIWSISTYLVSDQELSSAWWILMFLNIKVFLRDLLFSSSISLSNSLIVSNWFSHFILSFQTLNSISSLLLLAFFCFLFYLLHLYVYLSGGGVKLLLNRNKFLIEIIKLFIEQHFNWFLINCRSSGSCIW